jgi:hypothetical protein
MKKIAISTVVTTKPNVSTFKNKALNERVSDLMVKGNLPLNEALNLFAYEITMREKYHADNLDCFFNSKFDASKKNVLLPIQNNISPNTFNNFLLYKPISRVLKVSHFTTQQVSLFSMKNIAEKCVSEVKQVFQKTHHDAKLNEIFRNNGLVFDSIITNFDSQFKIEVCIIHPHDFSFKNKEVFHINGKEVTISVMGEREITKARYNSNYTIDSLELKFKNGHKHSVFASPDARTKDNKNIKMYSVAISAWDLYQMYAKYGDSLLMLNLRYQIPTLSETTSSIIQTFNDNHHEMIISHNGLKMACNACNICEADEIIETENVSLINGGQTTTKFYDFVEVQKNKLNGVELQDFIKKCKETFFRLDIIDTIDEKEINKLAFASNNQNNFDPRDYCSNNENQVVITNRLYKERGIFIETKTGNTANTDYKYQCISNDVLYQTILAIEANPFLARATNEAIFKFNDTKSAKLNESFVDKVNFDTVTCNYFFDYLVSEDGYLVKNFDIIDELLFLRQLLNDCGKTFSSYKMADIFDGMAAIINSNPNLKAFMLNHAKTKYDDIFEFVDLIDKNEKKYKCRFIKISKNNVRTNYYIDMLAIFKEYRKGATDKNKLIIDQNENDLHTLIRNANNDTAIVNNSLLFVIPLLYSDMRDFLNSKKPYEYNPEKYKNDEAFRIKLHSATIDLVYKLILKVFKNLGADLDDIANVIRSTNADVKQYRTVINNELLNNVNSFILLHDIFKEALKG